MSSSDAHLRECEFGAFGKEQQDEGADEAGQAAQQQIEAPRLELDVKERNVDVERAVEDEKAEHGHVIAGEAVDEGRRHEDLGAVL
jgi:hypothetical protein